MKSMGKLILYVVAFGLVGGAGWLAFSSFQAGDGAVEVRRGPAGPVAVETASLGRGTIIDQRTFTASLRAESTVVLAPKISGRLERLTVNVGDTVRAGDLIAELDDAEFVQEVERARAELAVSQARMNQTKSALTVAERDRQRLEALRARQVVSESDLDAAVAIVEARQADVLAAQAEVQQREASHRAAEIRQSYTRVYAAWPDIEEHRIVGERFVDQGALLSANTPIVSVIDLHPMTATFYVTEREYGRIHIGQIAGVVAEAFADETFTGRVARISPLFREASRQALMEVVVPNPDARLKPGMFARVTVELSRSEDAVWAPIESLVTRGGREGVFLLSEDARKVQFVPIERGISLRDRVELRDRNLTGQVVVLGQHLLRDGSDILLVDEAEPLSMLTESRAPGARR